MKIYTSYFARIKKLPADIIPIAICGKSPDGYKGQEYKQLAPTWDIYSEWKNSVRPDKNEIYTVKFNEKLNTLSALDIYNHLEAISGGKDVALICYEKSGDFCHRHLVAQWLTKHGIACKEFNI